MKAVKVHWRDSHGRDEWFYADNFREEALLVESIGFLFKEYPDRIVIVTSRSGDYLGNALIIPRECIVSIIDLTVKHTGV